MLYMYTKNISQMSSFKFPFQIYGPRSYYKNYIKDKEFSPKKMVESLHL